MLIDHGVYLAGDSYPSDAHTEREVGTRFEPPARSWTGQKALIAASGEEGMALDMRTRLQGLKQLFAIPAEAGSAVLFGRSSGARVATLFASRRPVRAVVCLAYPFRKPNKLDRPSRYRHLAALDVPTLIFQGVDDDYGGRNVVDDYALSAAVQVRFVQADHKMALGAEGWDVFERETRAFLSAIA